jgi:hypothetical protein
MRASHRMRASSRRAHHPESARLFRRVMLSGGAFFATFENRKVGHNDPTQHSLGAAYVATS